ncbi:integrase, catalytic region, zinc finger, CCHC-type containing protein [Tanacetum coccineum]
MLIVVLCKNDLALLAKYFKKLYKPTNNNLRTSSNSRNKTEDTTPRYNNDNQSGQFGNQRTMTVAGARETVGSPVVQQNGIQCFNCKGFGHYARECRKPKRVKDYAYHKEKMMMCKQAEQGVPLQAEQADWLEDTDEEIDEQELEAHYSYMAKIQEVSPEESSSTSQPLEQVQNHDENDVFANVRRHSEQPESINDTYVLEKDDSNVIPDSSNICTNDNQVDQNAAECVDERAALANLIANLTLDTEENKTILKQLKKANTSLTQELEKCKTNLDETNSALGEAISCRDSCLIALQNKQNEFEKYKALNDRTSDYKILQTKLNETLGLLALKDIDIQEGLKTKTYEISVVNQKHDELVKKSLLTRSQFEGQLKEKSKVISDLKVKEGKDIDTMIEMDKQIKFLNEILYKRNQSIQTIHMLAPKCATYNGRSTFANPKYLKIAQSKKPRLYEIPYDTSDPANRFAPDGEEIVTLAKESRSKLDKDKVKPYDYTYQNSLYETFKPPSKTYLDQLERAKEVRKTMWRKTTICGQAWSNHTNSAFPNPTAKSMEVLIKTLLMPLSNKTILDSHCFVHELKTEMHDDLEYVKSLEKEIDELESEKADFSNIYDLLLEECVSKDVTCSYLHSLSDLNANTELQCLYLHKVKECECLAQKLSKQTESVNKEVSYKFQMACVSEYLKDVNARTRSLRKSKSYYKELYENTNQEWKWWIAKRCPTGYTWTQKPLRTKQIWMPKIRKANESTSISPTIDIVSRITNIVQLILFIVDSGCTKHMTGNLKLLCNFVEKFLGTVRFGNDQFAPILGYGDLIQGNVTIKRVYYVEGLNHNLFRSSGSDLYTISLQKQLHQLQLFMANASPTQARLCHLKQKEAQFKSKSVSKFQRKAKFAFTELGCGPMLVASIIGRSLVPQGQKASDYDNSDPVPPRQNVVPSAEKTNSSQQGIEFLFSPLLEEYYNPKKNTRSS